MSSPKQTRTATIAYRDGTTRTLNFQSFAINEGSPVWLFITKDTEVFVNMDTVQTLELEREQESSLVQVQHELLLPN